MTLLGRDGVRDTAIYATAGVVAGLIFGLYGGRPMIEMISQLVLDTPDVVVGWIVHLGLSATFGAGYAELKGIVKPTQISLPMLGILYGIGLWVVGPVTGMPVLMGNVEAVPNVAVGSLWGHLIFGAVLQALGQVAVEFLPEAGDRTPADRRLAWW